MRHDMPSVTTHCLPTLVGKNFLDLGSGADWSAWPLPLMLSKKEQGV